MKTIIVTARKRDELAYGIQKYDNSGDGAEWNVAGGMAPNGVSATRYLRKTTPNVSMLSPLAAWLVENAPTYCGGKMPSFKMSDRVRVYNGLTEAEQMRKEFPNGIKHGVPVENFVKCYDLENEFCHISDWLFDIIEPGQSDEEYWNQQAANMIAAGAVYIAIGEAEWGTKPIRKSAAAALGSHTSEKKTAAARANASKPRPNAQGKPKPRKPKTE